MEVGLGLDVGRGWAWGLVDVDYVKVCVVLGL